MCAFRARFSAGRVAPARVLRVPAVRGLCERAAEAPGRDAGREPDGGARARRLRQLRRPVRPRAGPLLPPQHRRHHRHEHHRAQQ
eukprot:1270569-Rhodomonas_salina.1